MLIYSLAAKEFWSLVQAQLSSTEAPGGHLLSVSPWTTFERAHPAHGARSEKAGKSVMYCDIVLDAGAGVVTGAP